MVAVGLNDEPLLEAHEVNDVGPNGFQPTEAESEPATSKLRSQRDFGLSCLCHVGMVD